MDYISNIASGSIKHGLTDYSGIWQKKASDDNFGMSRFRNG